MKLILVGTLATLGLAFGTGVGTASAGCAANGALIASVAKLDGPNAGPKAGFMWLVEEGTPNTPGQSIKFAGKSGPGCDV